MSTLHTNLVFYFYPILFCGHFFFLLLKRCDFWKFAHFGFLLTKTIQMRRHNLCRSYLTPNHVFIFWQIYTKTYVNTQRLKIHTCTESHSSHSVMQSCNRPYVNRKEMKPCISCAFRTFLNISLFWGGAVAKPAADRAWPTSQNRTISARSTEGPSSQPPDALARTHTHKCLAL